MTAAIVKVILRELIKLTPRSGRTSRQNHWLNSRDRPAGKVPDEHGNFFQAKMQRFDEENRTQKLMVPHAGSARKRAMPIPRNYVG